ncbi:alpha-amylase family protein [Granulicoccus phenolivorans]|uniref:alpha-amylase family protein n=1 Tax=Granulicoccus phenolivorans TaxID=266854 RepID=UPI0003F739D6|nr:alpha-amylase family protein [Granulicoccus phenolivorans]
MVAVTPPPWVEYAIWWQVYPLGFCGAPIREADGVPHPAHRLPRLTGWLDQVIELGLNGLLLGPVFASQTHGYDTLDHYRIDPRLGDEADFDALVAACRERGIRVLLDGVFSHVGDRHPLLRQALAEGPDSAPAALFDIDWAATPPRPRTFEGHGALARLKHDSPAAVEFTVAVMRHWLARGVDGWRLDAAYSVAPGFWAQVLPRVRADYPQAWFLGEVIHGDYPQFAADSAIDAVTQYELWKSIRSSIAERNLFELDWNLKRHNDLPRLLPQTFVGNHDVTRIASAVGPQGAIVALAVLACVAGVPSIYAGDERGLEGVKEEREGGDDAIRPAFPDAVSEPTGAALAVFRAHQALIALRRQHPWLATARTTTENLANERATFRSTAADGSDRVDLAIDLTGTPRARITGADGSVLWASG